MYNQLIITILSMAVAIPFVIAQHTKVVITQDNYGAQLNESNKIFYIEDDIVLDNSSICIGENSILYFNGGRFKYGEIDINGATISAADYCIFDSTFIRTSSGELSRFGNDEVSALWFSQIGTDGDIAPVVNRALKTAPNCVVTLGGGTYTLKSSIVMDIEGQSFRHAGTLRVEGDSSAFKLCNSYLTLDLHNIESADNPTSIGEYKGTGIDFTGQVTGANIKVDKIIGMKYGIAFRPKVLCGSDNTKIDFMNITAKYGIYFGRGNNTFTETQNQESGSTIFYTRWCRDLMIFGGVINSEYGIYCEDVSTSRIGFVYAMDISRCIFNNITFGTCTTLPMRLRRMTYSQFPYLKFEDEAKACNTWIDVEDCSNLDFDVLEDLPYNKVIAGSNVNSTTFVAPITGPSMDTTHYINRMFIMPNPQNTNYSRKYLTSDIAPYNMVRTIQYPNLTSSKQTTISLNQILVNASEAEYQMDSSGEATESPLILYKPKILSDMCVLSIGKNQHITLDLTQNMNVPNVPITIVVNLSGISNSFKVKVDNSVISQIYKAGTYRISWDKDSKPQIIKVG